ncbi:endonuclease/exonuclease/phosphatase family protein [Geodermatophilus sp. TF02-6]|uniref:endonuclease/exonuclease/phosphatase family protein n=1 Tax=Geodermatophilus sp. TF02-6 TaxID=2250575 RepID=UPI001314813A|nr:endonuclease/exonuclease/phosphatase family protein [Geodermatophilus sp. TF02-6]
MSSAPEQAGAPLPGRRPTLAWRAATVAGVLLGLAAVVGAVAHVYPSGSNRLVALSAFSSHLLALSPLAAVLLALARRRVAAGLATVLTAGAVAVLLPTYVGSPTHAGGRPLTVLTANVELGEADPAGVVAAARGSGADVVLLQELTPSLRTRLTAAGLDQLLPHSVEEALPGADGVGLWSRHPLVDEQHHDGLTFAAVSARLDTGDGQPGPTVLTVHAAGPWPQSADDWVRDMAKLPGLLDQLAAQADEHGSPVLVGGDFNATWGNVQFRTLLQNGYRDAAEQFGAPWTATFPSGYAIPPLIGIDHVLVRKAGVDDLRTVEIPGSDHRGLLVRVGLPAG